MQRFAVTRHTREDEVTVGFTLGLPLVLEAHGARDSTALRRLLEERSKELLGETYRWGALLIRGFEVRTAQDFEAAMGCVEGLHPMSSYVGIERGRDNIAGTRAVFCTSSTIRTGGGLPFTGFHSENYYSPQVPTLQAFCCLKAPWLGGETGLIHSAAAYAELPAEMRRRLEAQPFLAAVEPITEIARRQGREPASVRDWCVQHELCIESFDGIEHLVSYKPCVYEHPFDARRALQSNVSLEIPGLMGRLVPRMLQCYQSKRWAAHRYLWRSDRARAMLDVVLDRARARGALPFLRSPAASVDRASGRSSRSSSTRRGYSRHAFQYPRLAAAFSDPELVDSFARASWRNMTAVAWRPGDILLFDNLQVLHAGLPGFGPRELVVQMYDPIVPRPDKGGLCRVPAQRLPWLDPAPPISAQASSFGTRRSGVGLDAHESRAGSE